MADQYKNTRPVSSRILRLSAPKLRENFRKLEEVIGEGHEFTTGGAQTGKHVAPTFKSLSEDPSQPTATDEVKLYNLNGEITSLRSDGKKSIVMPSGGIIMWSGSTNSIPSGWALCDGANGTPDLRDRFVIGAGGSRSVDETSDGQMPSHNHSFSDSASGSRPDIIQTERAGQSEGEEYARSIPWSGYSSYTVSGATSSGGQISVRIRNTSYNISISGNTSDAGSGSEVIAKYYALAYIMKL